MQSKYDRVFRSKEGVNRKMNSLTGVALSDLLGLIAIACFIIIAVVVLFHVVQITFAENFTFNMTGELIEEERVLEICRELNIKSDECNMIYGNTNNSVDDGRID